MSNVYTPMQSKVEVHTHSPTKCMAALACHRNNGLYKHQWGWADATIEWYTHHTHAFLPHCCFQIVANWGTWSES